MDAIQIELCQPILRLPGVIFPTFKYARCEYVNLIKDALLNGIQICNKIAIEVGISNRMDIQIMTP